MKKIYKSTNGFNYLFDNQKKKLVRADFEMMKSTNTIPPKINDVCTFLEVTHLNGDTYDDNRNNLEWKVENIIWRDVTYPGVYPGFYQISQFGTVRRISDGYIIKERVDSRNGYKIYQLKGINVPQVTVSKHRLVAHEYLPNPKNKPIVNHIDSNIYNCYYLNLEWVDYSENVNHAVFVGRKIGMEGERNPASVLSENDVIEICEALIATNFSVHETKKLISNNEKITVHMIKDIKYKNTWAQLSDKYFSKDDIEIRESLTQEEVLLIIDKLNRYNGKSGKVFNELHSKIPSLTYKRIEDIKFGKAWKELSDKYLTSKGRNKNNRFSEEEASDIIYNLIINDNKFSQTYSILKHKYPNLTMGYLHKLAYGECRKSLYNKILKEYNDMKIKKEFKDDQMTIAENDIQKLRLRPAYIIGYLGDEGVLHLCKEMIDNNRDECYKSQSPGENIKIYINDKEVTSMDDGRGIDTSLMKTIFETLNAGSNMLRNGSTGENFTGGENGVGTCALTALSSYLKVVSLRPNEKKKLTLVYNEGELVEETLEDYHDEQHGLITTFRPSKHILGTNKIPVDKLCDWIENFRYTLSPKIHMEYYVNGKKHIIEHKRLYEYFDEIGISSEKTMCVPYDIQCSGRLTETVQEKDFNRHFNLEASIVYTTADYKGDDIRKSWMNMISTFNNGMHMNGLINGLTQYLTEKVIQKKPALKDDDLKRDILAHLQIVLRCECDCANMFNSQEKSYVFPRPLLHAIEKAVYEEICNHPSHINDLVEIVIQNNRVRKAGEQARNVSKETKAIKSWEKPANFISCSSNDKRIIEISLCEGKSASGGVRTARDPKTQAIYLLQGKPLNAWSESLDRVLQSRIWRDLIKVLGCGIGPTFNIKNLKYSRIIIQTDADIDGFQIRVLVILFFWKWMPEIITEGKLYISEAPLYKIETGKAGKKNYQYIANKTEYLEKCLESVGNIKIVDDNFTSRELITDAFEYNNVLHEVAISRSSNPELLELIAFGFAKYGESVEDFRKHWKKWLNMASGTFKEIGFDESNNQVYGVQNLIDFVVVIDDSLIHELKYVIDAQKKFGLIVKYKYNGDEYASLLSEFFNFTEKRYPAIKDRYKGLGSNPAIATKEMMMDPNTRRLIRINVSDAYALAKELDVISGKTKQDILGRKKLLDDFEFTKEMLDN